MKFLDLNREYEYFNWEEAVRPIFENKSFINGEVVKTFEKQISKYLNVKYAIGISSGTDALMVAMMSLGLKNPVVLTTPYTFIATTEVPMRLGATIRFCDIDDTFNINMQQVKEVIKKDKIDIFIPVHLFGYPCLLDDELIQLCKKRGTYIIEDAAQSLGSSIDSKQTGTIGDLGCFSFFPSKNLGCAGDGGLIVTNSDKLFEKCLMIKNHGSKIKYSHEINGGNFRLDSIQAALLLHKLPYLNKFIDNRIKSAEIYNLFFNSIYDVGIKYSQIGSDENNIIHTYNQYVVKVGKNRDKLKKYLAGQGIPTALYYPKCLSEQPCYKKIDFKCKCEESKKAVKENLALPIAYLTKDEVVNIVYKIRDFYEK